MYVIHVLYMCEYRFQALTNMEQREWIEKLQEAILNALNLAPEKKEGKKGVKAAVRNTLIHAILLYYACTCVM